jgi:hypothetical protein
MPCLKLLYYRTEAIPMMKLYKVNCDNSVAIQETTMTRFGREQVTYSVLAVGLNVTMASEHDALKLFHYLHNQIAGHIKHEEGRRIIVIEKGEQGI